MDNQLEIDVLKANKNIASIVAQWGLEQKRKVSKGNVARPAILQDRSPAITNPAGFWAVALTNNGDGRVGELEIEQSVKLTAAKLEAGDISFVVESALGQIAWLSSLALEFKQDADNQPAESSARIRLLNLSLRAQGAAAKLMMSLGALAKIGESDSVIVSE